MSTTPLPLALKLRRNGRQQACEPCRKGKLGCNHAQPHCGRCVRRGMTDKCIYHPAPMTKSPSARIVRNSLSSTPASESMATAAMPLNGMLNAGETSSPLQRTAPGTPRLAKESSRPTSQSTPTWGEAHASEGVSSVDDQASWASYSFQGGSNHSVNTLFKPGLGLTTYSAVFAENRAKFAEILEPGMEAEPDVTKEAEVNVAACLTVGIKALRMFPSQEMCKRLMLTAENFCDHVLPTSLANYILETLWATHGSALAEPRDLNKLANLAGMMCKNGLKPLNPSPPKAKDWLDTFTGASMRWEILGLLYCAFGMGVHSVQDWDPFFDPHSPFYVAENRMVGSCKLKECAFLCLEMCSQTDTANEFVSLLLVGVGILESVVDGDESFRLWRRHSDTTTFSMAVGLHRLPDPSTQRPTAASLFRLVTFNMVYCNDVGFATFRGRPPSYPRRYCSRWLCYDLDDSVFFCDPEELEQRISRLGPDGWNYDGRVREATWWRASMILHMLREEILEISLSVEPTCDLAVLESIRQRCDHTYANFPKALHLDSDVHIADAKSDELLFNRIMTRLWYFHNIFLIERTAVTKARATGQGLLDISDQMLNTLLLFWKNQQRLIVFNSTFEWMIACYGLPPAGVLTVELLKQARRPEESTLRFSRSGVIQSLTIFCSFLEWVRPTDGNYKLCVRLRKVIMRILDFVLNESSKQNAAAAAAAAAAAGGQGSNTEVERPTSSSARPQTYQGGFDQIGRDFQPVDDQTFASLAVGPGSFEEMDFWLNSVDWTGQAPWSDHTM